MERGVSGLGSEAKLTCDWARCCESPFALTRLAHRASSGVVKFSAIFNESLRIENALDDEGGWKKDHNGTWVVACASR